MNLDEAISWANARPITAWMAWGVVQYNDGYVVVTGDHIIKYPDLALFYIRTGEAWPKSPVSYRSISL